jgi:hypothetical protein
VAAPPTAERSELFKVFSCTVNCCTIHCFVMQVPICFQELCTAVSVAPNKPVCEVEEDPLPPPAVLLFSMHPSSRTRLFKASEQL